MMINYRGLFLIRVNVGEATHRLNNLQQAPDYNNVFFEDELAKYPGNKEFKGLTTVPNGGNLDATIKRAL